jgi:hypothetical protein
MGVQFSFLCPLIKTLIKKNCEIQGFSVIKNFSNFGRDRSFEQRSFLERRINKFIPFGLCILCSDLKDAESFYYNFSKCCVFSFVLVAKSGQ